MLHSSHHLLRSREEERASVSYSELLFDLIYVFAVTLRRCSAFICWTVRFRQRVDNRRTTSGREKPVIRYHRFW